MATKTNVRRGNNNVDIHDDPERPTAHPLPLPLAVVGAVFIVAVTIGVLYNFGLRALTVLHILAARVASSFGF